MARVIISHLAPAKDAELRFLMDLVRAFEAQGHEAILWSGIYSRPAFPPHYLPLNWRLKQLPEYYADLTIGLTEAAALVDRAKWAARVDQLIKQDWDGADRTRLVDDLLSMSWQVLDGLKPDLLLSWNTLCPHTGVAHDMAQAMDIPSLLIEKAVFPDTWFIEEGGLLGLSVLAGKSLEDLVAPEDQERYRALGRDYLERTSFATYNRYAQVQDSPEMARLLEAPNDSLRPRVSFFPPDDGTLGFVPVDGADRKRIIPGYTDSFDAAVATAGAHGGLTIFKPHPSFSERSYPEDVPPGFHVIDYDFRKVMEWSDIVGTTGSGLEFVAMAMNKPVLLLANDILAGKGIAYEAQDPADLSGAIAAAQAREDWDARMDRFHTFCGYLVSQYLVSPSDAPGECRRPEDIVATLCADYLGDADTTAQTGSFHEDRAKLLTPKWAKKVAADTDESRKLQRADVMKPEEDPEALLAGLRSGQWPVVVLDFDHTLYRENSTERFLDAARPKMLAFLLVTLADAFTGTVARLGWCNRARWQDFMRVLFVTVGMPWAWALWRMSAAKRMAGEVNTALSGAVAEGKPTRVIILSLGMEHVIRPLCDGLPYDVEVIACSAYPRPRNLRKSGKTHALLQALSEEELASSVYVTDSPEDLEVCAAFRPSYLIQWEPYPNKAFHNYFMPFRYVLQGKYPNRAYLRNQIFKEEYLLLLLAYAFSPLNCVVLALLYASMYCIYEIGYWQNDHRAAKNEKKPTLSAGAARFASYPIHRAWIWAAAFGAAGIALAHWGETPLRDGTVGLHLGLWGVVLAVLYGVFGVFNRLGTYRRLYVFPFLHTIKVFACAALVPVTPLGVLLLASQATSQTGVYLIYRHQGKLAQYNRQTFRAIFFLMFSIAALAFAPETYRLFLTVQCLLILLWLGWRTVERIFQKSLGQIILRVLRDPRRIRKLIPRS